MTLLTSNAFSKKIVAVTGGSRGIGKTIITQFEKCGATVINVDLPDTLLKTKRNELAVDLSDPAQLRSVIKTIIKRFGTIDILVNNARSGVNVGVLEDTDENFHMTMNVGLLAPMQLGQIFINHAKQDPNVSRAIINISSVASQTVSSQSCSYHMSKAGLESMTRYLAAYGGEYAVRVNAVSPGFIVQDESLERFQAESNENYRNLANKLHPGCRVGTASDVANSVLFLASDAASFITGETISVSGGLNLKDNWAMASSLYGLSV